MAKIKIIQTNKNIKNDMVDKIIIPQTEEIAYLNNITPSYEEFMKTYNSDEAVVNSYNDEINSYGDLGVEKGYGPCSPSYCSGCDCSRSDCNCRSDEKYVKLYISCPADGCPGGKKSPTY
jgi:hypothetical protein